VKRGSEFQDKGSRRNGLTAKEGETRNEKILEENGGVKASPGQVWILWSKYRWECWLDHEKSGRGGAPGEALVLVNLGADYIGS